MLCVASNTSLYRDVRSALLWNVVRAVQLLHAVSGLRGLLEWSYNLMLLIMGFHIFLSVALFRSLSLSLALLVYTLSNTVSNFLRIIRPSSEPGQWKTLLRIAPSTSRFSSPRTSSTSNLQVGRECEIKYSGCDLRCQLEGVFLRLVPMQLLLFNRVRMQEIMGWHLLKNSFSWPNLTGGFCSVCVLSPDVLPSIVKDGLGRIGKHFYFAAAGLHCSVMSCPSCPFFVF